MFGFVYWPSLRRPSTKVHVLATVLKGWVLYSWYTLVPEVFLDFAPHERGLRESREAVSTSRDAKRKKDISHISRLVFGASREEEKIKKTLWDQGTHGIKWFAIHLWNSREIVWVTILQRCLTASEVCSLCSWERKKTLLQQFLQPQTWQNAEGRGKAWLEFN